MSSRRDRIKWRTRLSARIFRMRLDFADLEDVALLVRRYQQRPLVGVGSLPCHEMTPEIVRRRRGIAQQPPVVRPIGLEGRLEVGQLAPRMLAGNRLLSTGAVDAVPEDVDVSIG